MLKSYYVYILANGRNGTLYIGVTNDIVRRIAEHKSGQAKGFTKRYDVTQLVWFDETPDVNAAIQREKTMKRWPRAYKLNVIEEMNPQWRDLYDDLIAVPPNMPPLDPGTGPG
ncbi:GIY-YIG nuclease family protein [Parvibaculum sp.]|uniref:GIY-YIG nuclease family protein n=1 Tax=Parvibaculum sp. TaxID=2024848 RepID=UPI002B50BEBB|nr:GIY-YIG nuclease family protein [Parvibaculum sp.]HUD50586.1 GIY-YIG nuclease family protein [Parvibaculum sp.]